MSSGVSDQMKVPGSTGKNLERNIPWSQQVDEASYENLASPGNNDDNLANNSSMQFQYPPFNAKESSNNNPWNNFNKPRKSSNFENKKIGKPEFYNYGKRDDFQQNAWGRRPNSDNSGGYNRTAQNNRYDDAYSAGKLDNNKSSAANMAIEQKKIIAATAVAAPKKTTWASILLQPAKNTSRTTSITSSHKKKGPGMPPPPMVPGKHNLDVNAWELPNNNPPPVPSPPPPLDLSQIDSNTNSIVGPVSNMFRHDLAGRPDKNNKNNDYIRDNENKSNYNNNSNNYGRSPNGHSRKNWTTPQQQQQQQGVVPGQGGRSIVGNGPPTTGANAPPLGNVMRRSINDNNSGPNVTGGASNISGNSGGGGAYQRYRKPEPRTFGAGPPRPSGSESESAPYNNYRDENNPRNYDQNVQPSVQTLTEPEKVSAEAVLEELRNKNNYNPIKLDLEMAKVARFFVIKSYSEDDIHRSIKYELWCSTDHGNKRLDEAFKERQEKGGHVLLFFSVNGSGHFCGMAQMKTAVDYNCKLDVWSQDKWKGIFQVKWIYVKDVTNGALRHIRLENNENKSVTNSRDVQEVPNARGIEVLQIMHTFKNTTSIFDDFHHYEKKQEEEGSSRKPLTHYENINQAAASSQNNRHYGRHPQSSNDDRERDSRDIRGGGGGMGQKYFTNGPAGGNGGYRERNNTMIHRGNGGGYYSEYRRFDNHRGGNMDRGEVDAGDKEQQRDRDGNNSGGGDFGNNRYAQKFDGNRRLDERNPFKQQQQHNNRDKDRDFSEDKQNSTTNEPRF